MEPKLPVAEEEAEFIWDTITKLNGSKLVVTQQIRDIQRRTLLASAAYLDREIDEDERSGEIMVFANGLYNRLKRRLQRLADSLGRE